MDLRGGLPRLLANYSYYYCTSETIATKLNQRIRSILRPPPTLIDTFSFPPTTQDEVIDVNTTRSEMSFVPTIEDDGKTITCRAENPKVTGQFVEIPWKLNVVCK